MPSPRRFPSSSDPARIECAETVSRPTVSAQSIPRGRELDRNRDLRLMARAARAGGVVTTSDLRTCGFSEPAIRFALRRGLLTRWGRGVYLVGPLTDDLTEVRAAAAAMPHGTLGFGAAAQLAKIGPLASPPIDVIVSPGRRAGRAGVQIHRIDLAPRDTTRMHGLPLTTPAVTIVHLARTLPALPFERIVQEAFAKRLATPKQLEAALDRHRGGRGTARLRRMLELGADDLRSKAEHSLRDWIRRAGLPLPTFNAEAGPWRVDALWPEHRLAEPRRTPRSWGA